MIPGNDNRARAFSPRQQDYVRAADVVNSERAISQFAACEWEELSDDGRTWLAAIVSEAFERGQRESRT